MNSPQTACPKFGSISSRRTFAIAFIISRLAVCSVSGVLFSSSQCLHSSRCPCCFRCSKSLPAVSHCGCDARASRFARVSDVVRSVRRVVAAINNDGHSSSCCKPNSQTRTPARNATLLTQRSPRRQRTPSQSDSTR